MFERLRTPQIAGRVAVRLVVAIALASIATGLLAILTEPTLETADPIADLQAAAEFSGTVVGFALLVAAWGMRRGYRLAYVAAAALVLLAAVHGVVQSRLLSVPLIVLSGGGLAVLALTSERFTRSIPVTLNSTQFGALVAIVGVLSYGTAGAYALREQFDDLRTVVDALYFTLVTASTVGYGDIHPRTEAARLFAVSLVLLGPATVGIAVGSLFGPAIEARLARTGRRVTDHRSDGATDRVVLLGVDETTRRVAERLGEFADVTVVTDDESAPTELSPALGLEVHVGDPTAERTLEGVALETCDAVLVTATDDRDADEAVLAARAATDARVVVVAHPAAESTEYEGADVVVDPRSVVVDATVAATLGDAESASQSPASAASQSG